MYYGNFENWEDVLSSFEVDASELKEVIPLFASYDTECYEGKALVVYVHDGKVMMVEGSHCSCYALEGQWSPEEMPPEAMIHIINEGNYDTYFTDHTEELIEQMRTLSIKNWESMTPDQIRIILKLKFAK